jgi:hypothetical protein
MTSIQAKQVANIKSKIGLFTIKHMMFKLVFPDELLPADDLLKMENWQNEIEYLEVSNVTLGKKISEIPCDDFVLLNYTD